eukprot:CAMPEP_0196169134 /NCGR_PEP_ID=MMETSP0911-20130528/3769_1 /TAXON_ID=49265 /ORGANISM="Thalassiosira rotula, Strain GSO102" /LENGTH=32 /DNA_ID= /DNA_START= /DNA_END= /DNA_ORIENTATION=
MPDRDEGIQKCAEEKVLGNLSICQSYANLSRP